MEYTANWGLENAKEEIRKANYPEIRFFNISHKTAAAPQINVEGQWEKCSPESMANFSSVAYFFGREIHNELNVPVGLINSSWGGTPAEIWIKANIILQDKELSEAAAKLPQDVWGPKDPGLAYNAMIAPLIPFHIAGVLWYQGESNTVSPLEYTKLLTTLIQSWRKEWGYEFPFYYVQIAPFNDLNPYVRVLVRDAQRLAMKNPKTGMVVISDIADVNDEHPKNKKDVGLRLAYWALNKTYGKKDIPYSGPVYKEMQTERNKIRVFFDYAENGLVCKGDKLTDFEIAGEDKNFVKADAKIENNTVVVSSPKVKNPVAVRFAWSNTAQPNLFNTEGFPTSCFRTDNWEIKLK